MSEATITINGEVEPLSAPNIAALLTQLELAAERRGIAVARNGAVVPRAQWADTPLSAGDRLEILIARQGG
jgi:sulfur carrier protein